MSDAPLVSVEHLSKVYGIDAPTTALSAVDLRIERGEFLAIVGPSGSGKSTLLNLLGLLDRPSSGRVVLGGVDTTGMTDRELTAMRAKLLGFVFQFHHLLPAFNAVENVMLPRWGDDGLPSPELRARAEDLLRAVGLGHRLDRRTGQLSGGEQQRVAIARALVSGPALVLADEPTGNLDTASSDDAFRLLRHFHDERATTFVIVTHDERMATQCDRVVSVVDGRIAADRRR